ncbi:MAG TPA: hypothetical protein VMN78_07740 [Longimicrobiales bacterium]|nr:hypothetical protein [Longimicrobiales bacterium]
MAGTRSADDPGIIRFDFPEHGVDPLEPIDWLDWFAKFDAAGLVLLYQETTPDGARSNFCRLLEADAAGALATDVEWVDASPGASV